MAGADRSGGRVRRPFDMAAQLPSRVGARVMRIGFILSVLFSAIAGLVAGAHPSGLHAQTPIDPVGVVVTGSDDSGVARLGADWYLTYGFDGADVPGLNRAPVVRLTPAPDRNALSA